MPKPVLLGTLDGVNPPLDSVPLHSPESIFPESDSGIVRPRGVDDLRGRPTTELRYPATAAVLFAGIPGAGKSTALRRLFGSDPEAEHATNGPGDSVVLDSIHARNSWRPRLAWLPYPMWRPVVHLVHFSRIWVALRDHTGPVVIHDCGTIGFTRRMLTRWAARHGRELHMVLLDVPATVARAGQYARGRRVGRLSFHWHVWRWRRILRRLETGRGPRPAPTSVVVLDRIGIDRLRGVRFAA
ncbi:AAA family ATPase [Nocardia sp. NBC_00416]|uniref:AAA family ATPase n=1 Tax=Nocardia sp. NBC_00416 TaxID=2975991 RepID=UPI002E1D2B2B